MKFQDYEKVAKEYKIGGGQFWRPQQGDNKIRILTTGEVIGSHFVKEDNKSYTCIGKDSGCKYCKAGDKPNVKFLFWVLDRADGDVKIGQVGYSVFKQLGELGMDEDWKFDGVPDYDITIKRTGEKLKTEYFVQPTKNNKPLNEEEKQRVLETVKDLKEIVNKMKEKAGKEPSEIDVNDDINKSDNEEDEIDIEDIPFGDDE